MRNFNFFSSTQDYLFLPSLSKHFSQEVIFLTLRNTLCHILPHALLKYTNTKATFLAILMETTLVGSPINVNDKIVNNFLYYYLTLKVQASSLLIGFRKQFIDHYFSDYSLGLKLPSNSLITWF